MADGLPPNPQAEAAKVTQHNQQVAQQVADQGRELYDPSLLDNSDVALDELARQQGEGSDGDGNGDGEGADNGNAAGTEGGEAGGQEGSGNADAAGTEGTEGGSEGTEGDGIVEKKEGEGDGTADGDDGSASGDGDGTDGSGDAGSGDGAGTEGGDEGTPAEDPFKDDKLPDTATPKSAEAFESIKTKAREQITERDTKIAELTTQLEELKTKAENARTPEEEAELKELREFRAKIDVETDPKFGEFDTKIASASDFIYAQLERAGMGKEVIDKIKEYGGPAKVNMDKILDQANDPTVTRLVNAKLADIEQLAFDKQQAIKGAKDNITQYLEERQQAIEKAQTGHRDASKEYLNKELLPKFDFMKPPVLKKDATDDDKKLFEAQKAFQKNVQDQIGYALSDDSPAMRAMLIGGLVKMLHYEQIIKGGEVILKNKDAEIAKLQKELDDATEIANKLKAGSVSRRQRSNATGSKTPSIKPDLDPNQDSGEALDAIARRIQQQRSAHGVS